jgi:glycosyltransferase involved in cell wall biosynthesis
LSPGHHAAFRAEHSIPADRKILLFLSRLHPKKGIDQLLRAFASLRSLHGSAVLVIAGDGEAGYVQSLKRMGSDLGLASLIRWTGPLYDMRKWVAFSSADLFVLPSHQENFGIVIAEALAVGTPVCTTTAVNTHELIERYGAGIVCNDGEDDLVRALEQWQAMDAGMLAKMRDNARSCFERELRIDGASQRLLEAIEKAVAARKERNGGVH